MAKFEIHASKPDGSTTVLYYDNMTNDEISQRGKEKFFRTELMEKIIKYKKINKGKFYVNK